MASASFELFFVSDIRTCDEFARPYPLPSFPAPASQARRAIRPALPRAGRTRPEHAYRETAARQRRLKWCTPTKGKIFQRPVHPSGGGAPARTRGWSGVALERARAPTWWHGRGQRRENRTRITPSASAGKSRRSRAAHPRQDAGTGGTAKSDRMSSQYFEVARPLLAEPCPTPRTPGPRARDRPPSARAGSPALRTRQGRACGLSRPPCAPSAHAPVTSAPRARRPWWRPGHCAIFTRFQQPFTASITRYSWEADNGSGRHTCEFSSAMPARRWQPADDSLNRGKIHRYFPMAQLAWPPCSAACTVPREDPDHTY
jgi:hypothetical protein